MLYIIYNGVIRTHFSGPTVMFTYPNPGFSFNYFVIGSDANTYGVPQSSS